LRRRIDVEIDHSTRLPLEASMIAKMRVCVFLRSCMTLYCGKNVCSTTLDMFDSLRSWPPLFDQGAPRAVSTPSTMERSVIAVTSSAIGIHPPRSRRRVAPWLAAKACAPSRDHRLLPHSNVAERRRQSPAREHGRPSASATPGRPAPCHSSANGYCNSASALSARTTYRTSPRWPDHRMVRLPQGGARNATW